MGSFDTHHEIHELEGLRGPDGLAATGLFFRAGVWTAGNGRTGVVPTEVVAAMASNDPESVERLVRVGLWEECAEGYRMLRGPHSDPDQAMPLWRYSDEDLGGRVFVPDDAPNT